MLSQIRQISDGNHNTVFVKNKEQKFNLDKEIHDIECWKQSRNHVYRKEERELLAHLEKLRHQQEYLHHLDEDRALHPRGVSQSAGHAVEQRHTRESRESNLDNISDVTSMGRNNPEHSLALNLQGSTDYPQQPPPPSSPAVSLPPVRSITDHKALHRTDAHINICVICQLPRHSTIKHGPHHTMNEGVCCCEHEGQEELRNKGRRFTIASLEEHHHGLGPVPIEVGQRRHSLMMARLNDEKYEYKPHPPDRIHGGHNQGSRHRLEAARRNAKDHDSHNHHDNIHQHYGHTHHHHSKVNHHHSHDHLGIVHHHHGHDRHGNIHHHHAHDHHGNIHHHQGDHVGKMHHSGNELHSNPHSAQGHSSASQTHGNNPLRHNHHGNQTGDVTHTPSNSPHRSSRHSISHSGYNPPTSRHDPMYSAYHPADRMTTHGNHGIDSHSSAKRISDAALHSPGSLGTGVQDSNSDSRRRDHELHWDRHQVCKLRGMITDPHYKEQLEVESGKSYPWSSHYNQTTKTSSDEIEDLKNCRYLRFSKLNLESMKENPEEEVEVFEKKESPS